MTCNEKGDTNTLPESLFPLIWGVSMMQGEMIDLKMKASYTQINKRIITQMVTLKKAVTTKFSSSSQKSSKYSFWYHFWNLKLMGSLQNQAFQTKKQFYTNTRIITLYSSQNTLTYLGITKPDGIQ